MWMCERCQEINDDSKGVCSRCGTAKPIHLPPMAGGPPPVGGAAPPPMQAAQPQGRRGPQLVATTTIHDQYHTPYRIEGELVPVLTITVGQMPIYFEHYVLLWKHPSVTIGLKPLKGLGRRILAGMPILMTQAMGPGDIAFSRDDAGHIFPIHLQPGQEIDVREHQFLAATDNVEYTFQRVKGISNILFGGNGFFIDRFIGTSGDGVVWVHGYGNVFELLLGPGEAIDVEPGGWVYKDPTVQMQTIVQPLATGFLASASSFTFNRFIGPGRLGIQSMYVHFETAN
jgi:uncharacterized protein (AIM24 family)